MRNYPDVIEAYMAYTHNTEPALLHKRWACISMICACLQRKCYLDMRPRVYPNMYIVLTGTPGCRKGTAIAPVKLLLKDLNIPLVAQNITKQALIEDFAERSKVEKRDKDILDNVVFDMGGNDNLPPTEFSSHASLTVVADEFTTFIGYNNIDFITVLNEWFDAPDRWDYKTKNQGKNYLNNLWLNILGATTPDLLKAALPTDAIESGFIPRIVLVHSEDKEKSIFFPQQTQEETEQHTKILQDLDRIYQMEGPFHFECYDAGKQWYLQHEKNKKQYSSTFMKRYAERKMVQIFKLSMAISAARRDDMVITHEDFESAVELMDYTEQFMRFAIQGKGRAPKRDVFYNIVNQLVQRKQMSRSEVVRMCLDDLTMSEIDELIVTIERTKLGRVVSKGPDVFLLLNEEIAKKEGLL